VTLTVPPALEGYEAERVTFGRRTRVVFRCGSGPAVIVMTEIPGITAKVARFGRAVAEIGCTAVLPDLVGTPGRRPTPRYTMRSVASVCISREFSTFALGRTSPITVWLRALARAEHERCGGPGVGAVGMCLTGGFALAMMLDETMVAPVLSQPSLPFPLSPRHRRDLGVSDADLAVIRRRAEEGVCVLGLRFSGDQVAPPERFDRLREELGERFIAVELDSSLANPAGHRPGAHSVLTEDLQDRPGTPTRAAFDQVLEFLRERLVEVSEP
jgi:dienelactone hydrolase